MRYVEHKAKQGERWDIIALSYYGSRQNIRAIIRANPQYIGLLSFKGGEVIHVPILEEVQASQNTTLPLWKR